MWAKTPKNYFMSEPAAPLVAIPAGIGDHVQFDAPLVTSGNLSEITVDTVSPYSILTNTPSVGRITLAQGGIYLVKGYSHKRPVTKDPFHRFQIYDVTTGLPIGNEGCSYATAKQKRNSHINMCNAIVDTAAAQKVIELRALSGVATNQFRYSVTSIIGCWIEIIELDRHKP